MLHPPSQLAIRAQEAQRFIVFSYFVPAECPVATEATADVRTGKREDLSTDTHLSSMLHRYLPHFFNDDSMPPQQTLEGTTEVSVAPVAKSNIKEEDRFYPFSLPPLAQRFIGKSFNVPETSQPAVFATEYRVAKEATAGTATVKTENRWAARSLLSVLTPCLPSVFDGDFMPPEQTVEDAYEVSGATENTSGEKEDANESSLATEITVGTSIVQGEDLLGDKSPAPRLPPSLSHILDNDHKQPEETIVAREAAVSVSTVFQEEFLDRENPSAATRLPSVLPSSLPLVFDNDYKLPEEAVEGTSKCPVASEAAASVSTVLQEEFLAGKSPPAPAALPLRLPCTHSIDHKQLWETVEDNTERLVDTEESAVSSTVKREELIGDKNPVLALHPSLACIHDKDHNDPNQKGRGTTKEVYLCPHAHQLDPDANLTLSTHNDEPRTWTLEETKDYRIGIDIESEERSVQEEVRPREGLKCDADCAHSKSSNGMVSSERAETILGRVGFLVRNHMQKIPFLKMEEKEECKKLNKKLKDDEKERKEMKNKEEEQKKREKKEMKEREKEQKKVMKAEKKREKLEQKKREKERKEEDKAEKKRLEGLMKIHNDMMKDRIKKEKKCSEELKKRKKAQAEFLEMERKIQEKEEKKREKMRKEERKRLEKKKKSEPVGGGTERVIEEQGRDESLKMDE
ncbi:histone-lysine N-methyltransferase, H3 lysine-79 specific-like [Salmo salar]|uniref:Histone-lysine N-methyltransferase, H3 lysine-79 specific-like n=1 Tax=Salmo salar TaxID=8030 RepID=A0ABM3E7U1_SALSA|nr:histone-lysine N-methyltransferase, H3 lysine-79 specific-like [Salmo salar]